MAPKHNSQRTIRKYIQVFFVNRCKTVLIEHELLQAGSGTIAGLDLVLETTFITPSSVNHWSSGISSLGFVVLLCFCFCGSIWYIYVGIFDFGLILLFWVSVFVVFFVVLCGVSRMGTYVRKYWNGYGIPPYRAQNPE